MDNPETLATLGNKTQGVNKQNTTGKPIKMSYTIKSVVQPGSRKR
jgi:hypothetical protein